MKKKIKKNRADIIKYMLAIVALMLCWMTFKHNNTTELIVGSISLAYLCGLAIFETVSGFFKEAAE